MGQIAVVDYLLAGSLVATPSVLGQLFLLAGYLFLAMAGAVGFRLSKKFLRNTFRVSNGSRRHPIFLRAGIGAGKSRFLGRLLAWQDFLFHEVPLFIMDPVNQTISNFMDKLLRFPDALLSMGVPLENVEVYMKRLSARIRYVDRSGRFGYVHGTPLYYRVGDESLHTIANRFAEVVMKLDPELIRAPWMGKNALYECASNVGMLLFALGLQITEAERVIQDPIAWAARAKSVQDEYPDEIPEVIAWLDSIAELSPNDRHRLASTFLRKIAPFTRNPVMKATVGAKAQGVTGEEWDAGNLVLLMDYSHMEPDESQFMMRWDFDWLTRTVRQRGIAAGRVKPVSLIIDELAALFPSHGTAANQFATDVDVIVSQLARNYGLWTCLATQSLAPFQFSPSLIKALMNMKVQIQGATGDAETADLLARKFDRYEPYRVKEVENVYMSGFMGSIQVVDERRRFFTPEEQHLEAAYRYLDDLGTFEFLIQLPRGEGGAPGPLRKMSIAGLDRGIYPNEDAVAGLQLQLIQRDGISVEKYLAAVRALLEPVPRLEDLARIPFYAPS